MSSEDLDYSPLLPRNLAPILKEAAGAWRLTAEAQNAILLPLFTGIDGYKPDVFALHNSVNALGQAPIPLCQDIASYAQLFASIVVVVKDRKTLANSLQIIANRWHHLDPDHLTSPRAEIGRLLQYDAAEVKLIGGQFKVLADTIAKWTSTSTDPVFDSTLFDKITHILEPIARFPNTVDGVARFADAAQLSMEAVKKPLKEVFHVPLIGKPISTPEVVSGAVARLAERVSIYFKSVDKVVIGVDGLVQNLTAVIADAEEVPKGIQDFAAGHTSGGPVDAGMAKKAWTETGETSKAFVSAVVGKSSSASTVLSVSFAALATAAAPSLANVQDALAPPTFGASTLTLLAKQTLKTSAQLTTVMTLPYINSIKVKVNGVDVSLFEAVLKTKTSYESIQSRTIPIARDINSYSLMQETILPILVNGLPASVPAGTLFQTWITLADSYGTKAVQVAQDSQLLLTKFRADVTTLKASLSEVKARIAADKQQLAEAQAALDALKADMLINGILATLLTAGALAAAYSGEGELVEELGGKAGESLHKVVQDDIKAGELTILIHKIERLIAIAENTSAQLDSAISLVVDVVASMAKVGDIWTEIRSDLRVAQRDFSSWVNANVATDSALDSIANQWTSLKASSSSYVDSILGIESPTTLNLFAVSVSGVAQRSISSVNLAAPPSTEDPIANKFSEVMNDEKVWIFLAPPTSAEDRLKKFLAIQTSVLDNQFYNAIKAPSFALTTNRQTLNNSASAYQQAASIMQPRFPSDATNLRNLATKITNNVIPSVSDSVNFYKTFANRQVAVLSTKLTKGGLQDLAAENAKLAAQGFQKAQASQTIVLNFKNDAVLVENAMIQRTNELQSTVSRLQKELQDQRNELAKYDWVKWVPGIGAIIKLIVEAIMHTEDQIRDLNRQVADLQNVKNQVQIARSIVDPIINTVATLTTSWANLTQEASDLSAYLKLISDVPETAAALADLAKQSWNSLNSELARW